jgi:hypothetical protein
LFQYLRVFERGTFSYRFSQLTLVAVALWGLAILTICSLPCIPDPSRFWKQRGKGCWGIAAANQQIAVDIILGHAATNVFFDTIVFGLAFRLQFLKDAPSSRNGARAVLSVGVM